MGVIKNQSIKTSILFGIGVLLGFVLRLYVFPSYLKPNEIGLLTVLLDMSNIFGALIPLGGQTIFIRYLSKFKSDNVKSDSLRTLVLQLTILGLILFTITFFLLKDPLIQFYQDQAALLSKYFLVILPMVYFRVLYLITTAYSKGSKRTVFPLFVKEIFVRLSTILLIILYAFLALNTEILVSLYLGIYFLSGTLVFISIRKFGGWSFSKSSANVGQDLRKEILVFGSFSILTSVGTIMIRSIDSIMLSSLKDLDSAGIYSIAFFIGVFVEIPRRAISQISRPVIAEAFHEGKISVIRDIYQKSALNQLLLGSFIYILIVGSLDSLFAVIPNGEIYSVASNVVLIIGAAKLFDMSMGGNSEIIGNSPFYRYNFVSLAFMAPLGILTNLWLIPVLGVSGAAWASLITLSVVNIFRFSVVYVKTRIFPMSTCWFKSLTLVAIFLLLAAFIQDMKNPWVSIVLKTLLLGLGYFSCILLFKLSPDLYNLVSKFLKFLKKE